MKYEITSKPQIQSEYSDSHETTMVVNLKREDGVEGDVWIVAGVPDYLRGSSDAARTQHGYTKVRVFGDSPDTWCPDQFIDSEPDRDELLALEPPEDFDDPEYAEHRIAEIGRSMSDKYAEVAADVVAAVEAVALQTHTDRTYRAVIWHDGWNMGEEQFPLWQGMEAAMDQACDWARAGDWKDTPGDVDVRLYDGTEEVASRTIRVGESLVAE